MSKLRRKKFWTFAAVLGCGTVLDLVTPGIIPRGCADYMVVNLVTAFDVCSVINCDGGTYFDFCNPASPFFTDCPNQYATTEP